VPSGGTTGEMQSQSARPAGPRVVDGHPGERRGTVTTPITRSHRRATPATTPHLDRHSAGVSHDPHRVVGHVCEPFPGRPGSVAVLPEHGQPATGDPLQQHRRPARSDVGTPVSVANACVEPPGDTRTGALGAWQSPSTPPVIGPHVGRPDRGCPGLSTPTHHIGPCPVTARMQCHVICRFPTPVRSARRPHRATGTPHPPTPPNRSSCSPPATRSSPTRHLRPAAEGYSFHPDAGCPPSPPESAPRASRPGAGRLSPPSW
jgi:hypothetical protein